MHSRHSQIAIAIGECGLSVNLWGYILDTDKTRRQQIKDTKSSRLPTNPPPPTHPTPMMASTIKLIDLLVMSM